MKAPLDKGQLTGERFFPVFLTFVCLALYVPGLAGREFWCGRETLYAQVARDMLHNGHWFVPYFNGELYVNKPPLFFWLIALTSMPVGDITPVTMRLPSAVSALGTVLVVYFLGRRLYGARTGLIAGLILASSPGFYKYACVGKLELLLSFFITASIAAFYFGLTASTDKRRYFLWAWFLMGLAMLTKGLGVALIVPVILLYLLSRRELYRVWETRPILGGLILLATMAVWLLPGYLSGGQEYIHGLVEHFSYHVSKGPKYMKPFYYLTESFVGTLPWSLVLPGVFFYLRRGEADERHREGLRLTATWFLAMWVVFSLIMAKRSRYILPMYPAVALAAAVLWEDYVSRSSETWANIKTIPVLALSLLSGTVVVLVITGTIPLTNVTGNVAALCLVLLLLAWLLSIRDRQYKVLFISLFLMITSFEIAYMEIILPVESQAGTEKVVCEKALANMEPGARWTLYGFFSPDYVFYSNMTIKSVSTQQELADFFSSEDRVYCLVDEEDYAELDLSPFNVSAFKIATLNKTGKRAATYILISNRPGKRNGATQEVEL